MKMPSNSLSQHVFNMVPKAEIPRSKFDRSHGLKTTFDAGYVVPILVDEVLPGDTVNCRMTAFARLATPLFPIMDTLKLATFFFFVPNRLLWTNWKKFQGEQDNPGDSTSFTVPTMQSPVGGYAVNSLHDYMGLPTVGQVGGGNQVTHTSLHLRAYNQIFSEWFRDQNLQNSLTKDVGDGPDTYSNYTLQRRGKRHDYFTSCLPWPQKGTAVPVPLTGNATVNLSSTLNINPLVKRWDTHALLATGGLQPDGSGNLEANVTKAVIDPNGTLYADLSSVSGATISTLRQSFQIQKAYERDARGGTRYTEALKARWGVTSPDARLQRPEYLGGGVSDINITPVPKTSTSDATSPQGALAGFGVSVANKHGFVFSATEHGVLLGLVCVYAELTYQQGLERMWSRSTRFDFHEPVFSTIGEQAVLTKEIYCDGSANDAVVFGYQERSAEYRYKPSKITGKFKSTSAGTIDTWHLAQKFTSAPLLNSTFIQETPPMSRVLAATAYTNDILFDAHFEYKWARCMPLYGVPGLIDHF